MNSVNNNAWLKEVNFSKNLHKNLLVLDKNGHSDGLNEII